ncbi:MAG: glycosyltransferase, exosortase A system-associated [Pirellulales bacterium]|nr:glycosyltransferase, exosortase A system-associated [Pirellulales bacterium]
MKILHVLDHSVPETDGYCVRSANIVQFQKAHGLEPVVVTSAQHEAEVTGDVEVIDGIRYHRMLSRGKRRLPFLRELESVRRMAAHIDEVVRTEQPDVLHAHSPCLWGEATRRVAKRRGLPFVYEIRGFWEDAAVDRGKTGPRSPRYRLSRALETWVCRSADLVVTIAEHLKADLAQRGIPGERILLVPNGVETDRFEATTPDERLIAQLGLQGATCIGYIGSLFPWEGVEDMVRAARLVGAKAPEARFLVVGGGERETAIRELIGQLDVADRVQFVGRVPHSEIGRYYSILDILVYPRKSTRNTEMVTPLKPLEAMAMQKAVLGSDVGGISELIAEGTGLRYRAGDPADLARKCLELIDQPQRRRSLGQSARRHVLATRDWRTLTARYLDAYAALADAHRPSEELVTV